MSDDKEKLTFPLDDEITEQDVAEGKQERVDHAALKLELEEILRNPRAVEVAAAVRRLVDRGVSPLVVAKTCLIGDREGGIVYTMAAQSSGLVTLHGAMLAVADQELVALRLMSVAVRDLADQVAVVMLTVGATWLAEQFRLSRPMLSGFVVNQAQRPFPVHRRSCPGALDYVDGKRVASRVWLLEAIATAKLPSFAPLEYSEFKP